MGFAWLEWIGMETLSIGSEIVDKLAFVRNVNVGGVWKQITISLEEREEIQQRLLEEQAYIYIKAWNTAVQAFKENKIMVMPGDIHDLVLQMTERTTPHIHMVYQNYLEQKAKVVREQPQEETNKMEVEAEAAASVSLSPSGARFEEKNGDLFINGKKVLKAWVSFSGWYWFAVEKVQEQESLIKGKAVKDTIWFGLVQGFEEEWGDFSQAELESLGTKVWEIPKKDIPYSGRRRVDAKAPVSALRDVV